jgi:hypothetical protein
MRKAVWVATVFGAVGFILGMLAIGLLMDGGVIISPKHMQEVSDMAAKAAEASSLTPYCVAASIADPHRYQVFLDLKEANFEKRTALIAAAGWATPLGASTPNTALAVNCLKALGF